MNQFVEAVGRLVDTKVAASQDQTRMLFQQWTSDFNNKQVPSTVAELASRTQGRPIVPKATHQEQLAVEADRRCKLDEDSQKRRDAAEKARRRSPAYLTHISRISHVHLP